MKYPFLTARWLDLVVVNFEVDPELLVKYLPRGTELDLFDNKAFVSIVGFRFEDNKLFGLIPSFPCSSFEEVNLRYYIRRGGKRAVAFIKEVVPSTLIAGIARTFYQEPYVALKTSSEKVNTGDFTRYAYSWGNQLQCKIGIEAENTFLDLEPNSFEEFILEHYWGYTPQSDGSTVEYEVSHPRWKFSRARRVFMSDEARNFYGPCFGEVLAGTPFSAFVAKGSDVSVSLPGRYFYPLNSTSPKGWVLYDAACGFCSWWIPFWKGTIDRCGYKIAPLQSEWVKEKLQLSEAEVANDIRLLLNDGTVINGADAYIYGMKRVWWSFIVGFALGLPGLRQLTWVFYRVFNRNRFFVSKVCRLKPEIT